MENTHKFVNILLVDGDKVLLQLRDDNPEIFQPNVWSIPGGRVNEGESEEDAVKREFEEETGYELKNPKFCKKVSYDFYPFDNEIDIFMEQYDGEQEIGCFEGQEMKFISVQEIDNLPFFPMHASIIKDLIKKPAT